MASSKILLALLAFLATAASVANGYTALGKTIPLVNIHGNLLCSSTGNPESGKTCPPLANIKVALTCPGIPLVFSYTDSQGSFACPIDTKTYPVIDPFQCYVEVQLPLDQIVCPVLSTVTGTLHALSSVLVGMVEVAGDFVADISIGLWDCLYLQGSLNPYIVYSSHLLQLVTLLIITYMSILYLVYL